MLPQALFDFGRVMVEQRLEGTELTVGILGHDPLPVIQVRPAAGLFDYAAKYERDDTDYAVDPGLGRTAKRSSTSPVHESEGGPVSLTTRRVKSS